MRFKVYKHRYNHHWVQWEKVVDKVYLGPRKRAVEALRQPVDQVLDEYGYLNHLAKSYPDIYESLEWVRFYSFVHKESPDVPMRLAVSSVAERPALRDRYFQLRAQITRETGWYPLVQGSRAFVHDLPYVRTMQRLQAARPAPALRSIGLIQRIEPLASSSEDGSCFLVEGSTGALILDSGFHGPDCPVNAAGVVLTHMHRDHSGGVFKFTDIPQTPVFMSETTMSALWWLSEPGSRREALASLVHTCNGGENFRFDDGFSLEFFRVFHCPGALGVRLQDISGHRLVYFGDLCLRNGFHTYAEQALSAVLEGDARRRTVILDATMAGRKTDEIDPEDTPQNVLSEMADGVHRRNVIFLSNQLENLLYTYLQVFYATRLSDRPVRIIVEEGLYQLLRSLLKPLLKRNVASIDPVVRRVVGDALTSNFVESHRLYPLTNEVLAEISIEEPVVVLARPEFLGQTDGLAERLRRAVVYLSGTMALREDIPEALIRARPKAIVRVASPDWSFHSSERDLVAFIQTLTDAGVEIRLFHSFPKTLRKFIRDHNFDPNKVLVIGQGAFV